MKFSLRKIFPVETCCFCIRLRNGVFIIGGFQILSACYQIYECAIVLEGTHEKNVRMRNVLINVSKTSVAFHIINVLLSFGLCVVSASFFKGARNFLVCWCIWVLVMCMFLFGKIIILARIVKHPLRLYLKISINVIFVMLNAYFLAVALSYIRYLDGYVMPKQSFVRNYQASSPVHCSRRSEITEQEQSDVCHLMTADNSEASTHYDRSSCAAADCVDSSFSQNCMCKLSPMQESHLSCPPPPNPSFKDDYIDGTLK